MVKQSFSHVEHWVFDLDNTLYHPSARLFDQIEAKMITYVMTRSGSIMGPPTSCAAIIGAITAPRWRG